MDEGTLVATAAVTSLEVLALLMALFLGVELALGLLRLARAPGCRRGAAGWRAWCWGTLWQVELAPQVDVGLEGPVAVIGLLGVPLDFVDEMRRFAADDPVIELNLTFGAT